ncbi:hypothetical protein ACEPAG_321 [Sanghuangporus baumii]
MAAASDTSTARSLLSRMVAPSVQNRSKAETDKPRLRKRGISDETNQRPNKRRRGIDERDDGGSVHLGPWLKAFNDPETETTCEERLHDELLQFVEYITPNKREREARSILVAQIEKLLKSRWLDAKVTVFGSSVTGLDLTGGRVCHLVFWFVFNVEYRDIDLVVSFEAIHSMSDLDRKARLAAMGDILKRSGMTTWVNRIFGARVPIIKFETIRELGGVPIDISIRNDEDAGVRAIPLIKQYLADLPALRPLILAVKAFLSLRDLNDASQGTLSSYAITLLCISFLQRNPAGRPKEQLDDPYTAKSLGLLLMDFFQYYGHDFPYATHYVSVSERDVLPKKLKSWEVKRSNPAILAVQCILNPEKNITRGCSEISFIIEQFKEALNTLLNVPFKRAKSANSLLSCIYEIPEEDQTRRALINESVDSGTFSHVANSCSGETSTSTRTVSGGVLLANRSDRQKRNTHAGNESGLLKRLGPGPMQVPTSGFTAQAVQQLPALRWSHDRGQRQLGPDLTNNQFNFQQQLGHYQVPRANPVPQGQIEPGPTAQQVYPSHQSKRYNNHRFRNNTGNAHAR